MDILNLIGRTTPLFEEDIASKTKQIEDRVSSSSFLVLGGAGSIGQAVVKEIFKRNPIKLHVVDISENNLAELVRDIRSSFGYIKGDFQTFALDIGSSTYDSFIDNDGRFDYVLKESQKIDISTARFANVAFSDGSLLHSFKQRIDKRQPIVAPTDVKRYFVTPEESGQLCLMSCLFGETRDIFFPKLSEELDLITFSSIAEKYLNHQGYAVHYCSSEKEAREAVSECIIHKKWPCFFTVSDTTGEKSFEEFYMPNEHLDLRTFEKLGIVKSKTAYDEEKLNHFITTIETLRMNNSWTKEEIVLLFFEMLPELEYEDKGKYLDSKM